MKLKLGVFASSALVPRAVFAGGFLQSNASTVNTIDYVTIVTEGNATDFGDLTTIRHSMALSGSSVRSVWSGGAPSENSNTIDYVTIATTGNATDFGDLTVGRWNVSSASSSTRGIAAGGTTGNKTNIIDYITIATTGNAIDFGDLVFARLWSSNGLASSGTRGVIAGDFSPVSNAIDYITIATTGNAIDFGDLAYAAGGIGCCSSSTRALFFGGYTDVGGGQNFNIINYVTIATTGNATDFGDLSIAKRAMGGSSSQIRGLLAGGAFGIGAPTASSNVIDYVTIATTGNPTDFGDLTVARESFGGISNCHGGIA
jgi:hypothetical protein